MRPAPHRIERLPQQYFTALLARVSAAAALDGEPLVDLGRGNPEVGPPQHVIDALAAAANEPSAHGYPPFRGLPALREAIAARYSALYGVELMPHQPPNARASWSSHRGDSAPWEFSLSCSQIATGALDWIEIVD